MGRKSKSKRVRAPVPASQHSTSHSGGFRIYNKTFAHILLITVIGLLAYSNSFSVPFMFDDKAPNGQIEDNLMIRDFGNFSLALKGHDFSSTEGYIFVPRRFIGYLSFAMDYKIHGLNLAGYHIVNIAIHIINALLVYFLVLLTFKTPFLAESGEQEARGRSRRSFLALFSSLLFVSHPIQTESVTYIVQRFASLATLFYLLSLVLYIKGRLRQAKVEVEVKDNEVLASSSSCFLPSALTLTFFILSLLSAVLAMLTKEISFTLPLMVILYELIFFRHTVRTSVLLFISAGIIVIGSSALMLGISGSSLGDMLSDLGRKTRLDTNISRWDYLLTQARVIMTYLRLLFLPAGQNLDYDYSVSGSLFDPGVLLSFTFLFLLFAMGVYLLTGGRQPASDDRSNGKNRLFLHLSVADSRMIGFGILWFFVTLSVESSIIPLPDVIFEHRMYLPSVGVFIALTQAVFIVASRRNRNPFPYASVFLMVVVVIFSFATFQRNAVWQNEISMWEDIVKKSPNKTRALHNLASAYMHHNSPEAALPYLKRAIVLDPAFTDAYRTAAIAYMNLMSYGDAIAAYEKVLEIEPDNAGVLNDIAGAYIKTKDYEAAREAVTKALSINPSFPMAYNTLGTIYRKLGSYEESIEAINKALRLHPDFAAAYDNMGLTFADMKRFDEAALAFVRSVAHDPSYTEAYNNLGCLYLVQKNVDRAVEVLQKAVATDQSHINARKNLAVAYALKGDRNAAMEQYSALKNISPPDAEMLLQRLQAIKR